MKTRGLQRSVSWKKRFHPARMTTKIHFIVLLFFEHPSFFSKSHIIRIWLSFEVSCVLLRTHAIRVSNIQAMRQASKQKNGSRFFIARYCFHIPSTDTRFLSIPLTLQNQALVNPALSLRCTWISVAEGEYCCTYLPTLVGNIAVWVSPSNAMACRWLREEKVSNGSVTGSLCPEHTGGNAELNKISW